MNKADNASWQGFGAFEPVTDMPLDKGIRPYVLALRSGGVETFESCEGGEGHPCPEPTIRFFGDLGAGFSAYGVARTLGLPVRCLQLEYPVDECGLLKGPWWRMVFTTKAEG